MTITPLAPPALAVVPPVPRVVPFVTVKRMALFDSVGLVDGTGNYRTRSAGCPALAPLRRPVSKATGRRRWPGNLPRPGQRACDVVGDAGRLLPADVEPIRLGPP